MNKLFLKYILAFLISSYSFAFSMQKETNKPYGFQEYEYFRSDDYRPTEQDGFVLDPEVLDRYNFRIQKWFTEKARALSLQMKGCFNKFDPIKDFAMHAFSPEVDSYAIEYGDIQERKGKLNYVLFGRFVFKSGRSNCVEFQVGHEELKQNHVVKCNESDDDIHLRRKNNRRGQKSKKLKHFDKGKVRDFKDRYSTSKKKRIYHRGFEDVDPQIFEELVKNKKKITIKDPFIGCEIEIYI